MRLRDKLDAYQLEALMHLHAHKRAALFWEMSLGKTLITLAYISEMPFGRVLVVAPNNVAKLTWKEEAAKWSRLTVSVVTGDAAQRAAALRRPADIYTVGAHNVVWLIDQYITKKRGKYVGELPFDCIVFDESTLFKSRGSNRFKRMARAVESIDYRILLSGTPKPNGDIDLWAQYKLLDGGDRLGRTFGEYVDKYFRTRGNGMIVYEYVPKAGSAKTIAHKIADITITKNTRDEIKDLPALHVIDEELTFDPYDKEIYDFLEREYVLEAAGLDVTVRTASDLSNKLLQLTSGAVYDENKVWHPLNTLKLDVLGEIVDENPRDNIMVVYAFKHEVERIRARFPYAELFSEDSKARWNEGRVRMLLLHPASAGHGLNLQFGGRRMVMFTVTWNLEHYLQVIARMLRRGLKDDMYLHRLLVRGTRDMKVRARLGGKQTNQQFLMDEVKELRAKYEKEIRKTKGLRTADR